MWPFSRIGRMLRRADNIVTVAQIGAVGMMAPLSKDFPFVSDIEANQWDFIVSIAAVCAAIHNIKITKFNKSNKHKLVDRVVDRLAAWNPLSIDCLMDCETFVAKSADALKKNGADHQSAHSDALGTWIVWNLVLHAPATEEERRLARTIGLVVPQMMHDFWMN